MKRLLLLVTLLISVSSIIPRTTERVAMVSKETNTILLPEVIIIDKKIKIPKIPFSFIADTIFNKQLYAESHHTHLRKRKDGTIGLITSPAGAIGIAQFMPSTWNWLKSKKILPSYFSIEVKKHQLAAQKLYMNYLARKDYGIDYSQIRLALAAYNAGSGRVRGLVKKHGKNWEQHLPKETKNYLKAIIG